MRTELDHYRTEQLKIQQQQQNIQNELNETADPARRRDLNELLSGLKFQWDQAGVSMQQTQTRESEWTSQLQSERGKLAELNDRLNQMEQTLSKP